MDQTREPGAAEADQSHEARKSRMPPAYRRCEQLTEFLIFALLVLAPWLFGTTEKWSVWTLNVPSYVLGALLVAKWVIRRKNHYKPPRWITGRDEPVAVAGQWHGPHWLTFALGVLTLLILAFCFTSALNARAQFDEGLQRFDYFNNVHWLPFTYDRARTFEIVWSYLALACYFWALRDWLLGKTLRERHPRSLEEEDRSAEPATPELPGRLRRLLWVLSINASLLAVEGILQRFDGTTKLLWLRESYWGRPDAMFGPFSYRGNAAEYFNLIWPVTLGLWWNLRHNFRMSGRAARVGGAPHAILVPCSLVIVAAPVISTSRGGAIIAFGALIASFVVLLAGSRKSHWLVRVGVVVMFCAMISLGAYLGWDKLGPRMKRVKMDNLSNRSEIYENSKQMAADFPLFGSGPGSFAAIYHLYRADPSETWQTFLHDDWQETRVTFGQFGFTIVMLMLALVLARWFVPGGIASSWQFIFMVWIAVGGCLVHAKFDFPLQVYSILQLFLTLCCILFCVSRKAWPQS